MISDLPWDVAEEVLSRLPMKSMSSVRSTCKNWNTLSKRRRFTKRHIREIKASSEFMVVTLMANRLYLTSMNLHGVHNDLEPSINHQGKLFNLTDGSVDDIHRICHCDGLLLCILLEGSTRMVVWNPYLGQTRWFKPISSEPAPMVYKYGIGYDQNSKSYKILRYFVSSPNYIRYEVYYFNNSREDDTIPITFFSGWDIDCYAHGASVKGNTYWFAQEQTPFDVAVTEITDFLICFDFTRERFGPRLSLPFHSYVFDCVTLYSVRDEQLAVLFQGWNTFFLEIWITNKIEPDAVSWNSKVFLAVDMDPLLGFPFPSYSGSFFVDEEKKVAVVFDNNKAYVIGEGGEYFKEMDVGIPSNINIRYPPVISYVPSLVQIKQRSGKRKKPHC